MLQQRAELSTQRELNRDASRTHTCLTSLSSSVALRRWLLSPHTRVRASISAQVRTRTGKILPVPASMQLLTAPFYCYYND